MKKQANTPRISATTAVPTSKDTKVSVQETDGPGGAVDDAKLKKAMSVVKNARGGKGLGLLRTMLWQVGNASSASGAALDASYTVDISAVPEVVSAFSTIYDEVKLHRIIFRYHFDDSISVGPRRWSVVCYDPLDAAALGSVVAGLEASQHKLTTLNGGLATTTATPAVTSTPLTSNSDGIHTAVFNVKPVAGFNTSATQSEATGNWHTLTAVTPCLDGTIKYFVEGVTGNVVTINYAVGYDVSFRSRT